jgi:hypothetical protein
LVESDSSITDGFGGGPYYTSLDEATLAAFSEVEVGQDVESCKIGAGYEFEKVGIDGLVVELVYGEFYSSEENIQEKDFMLTYEINNRFSLEGVYSDYKSSSDENTFNRVWVRLDYTF